MSEELYNFFFFIIYHVLETQFSVRLPRLCSVSLHISLATGSVACVLYTLCLLARHGDARASHRVSLLLIALTWCVRDERAKFPKVTHRTPCSARYPKEPEKTSTFTYIPSSFISSLSGDNLL